MFNNFFHIDFYLLLRQFTNCWLGYVLSQPVDIDVPVIVNLLLDYVGLSAIGKYISNNDEIVSGEFNEEHSVNDLVPQESYSR